MSDETPLPADTLIAPRKRGGRPSKARGAPMSSDAAEDRWTVRGVMPALRNAAVAAAKERGEPVGEWLSKAIHLSLRPGSQLRSDNALVAAVPVEDRIAQIETQLAGIATFMQSMAAAGITVRRPPFWKRWRDQ